MVMAGSTVKGGYYFNRDRLDLVAVAGKEGILPGEPGERCQRVPTWLVVLLAPLLGVLFIVLMPLVGLVTAGRRLVGSLVTRVRARRRPGAAPQ